MTHLAREADVQQALDRMRQLPEVAAINQMLRVFG